MQAGDFLLSSNILLSGNNYAKVALLLKFMNIRIVNLTTHYTIQDTYCVDTIKEYWEEKRSEAISRFQGKDVVLLVRRSENATQWPPQAAAEEMPPQNAFRSPVNERAEGEQYQEEISMQYYGSPSRSAVTFIQAVQCEMGQEAHTVDRVLATAFPLPVRRHVSALATGTPRYPRYLRRCRSTMSLLMLQQQIKNQTRLPLQHSCCEASVIIKARLLQ
ncbi:unnamed protein product [Gadus morhua 'NCC']